MTIPALLHWNYFHLGFNLFLFLTFVLFLELLAGSTVVAAAYALGTLASNTITSIIFMPWIHWFFPDFLSKFSGDLDVGSSLGIFSCLGACIYLFKYNHIIFPLMSVLIVGAAFYQSSLQSLNHLVAISLGFLLVRYLYPKELVL